MKSIPVTPQQVDQAHELYCQLTGQRLSLGFDRQRLWFEVLRLGYGPEHIRRVVGYLQREIRAQRRNVGALKLSNLLVPERFEEDLQISRVKLKNAPPKPVSPSTPTALDPTAQQQGRQRALRCIEKLKAQLQIIPGPATNPNTSREEHEKSTQITTDHSENPSTD